MRPPACPPCVVGPLSTARDALRDDGRRFDDHRPRRRTLPAMPGGRDRARRRRAGAMSTTRNTCSIFKDALTLVVDPIERMMTLVQKLAENPLGDIGKNGKKNKQGRRSGDAEGDGSEISRGSAAGQSDSKASGKKEPGAGADADETVLLEQTLGKISGLLQACLARCSFCCGSRSSRLCARRSSLSRAAFVAVADGARHCGGGDSGGFQLVDTLGRRCRFVASFRWRLARVCVRVCMSRSERRRNEEIVPHARAAPAAARAWFNGVHLSAAPRPPPSHRAANRSGSGSPARR